MSPLLFLKNLVFTVLVPGSVGFWIPFAIARSRGLSLGGPWDGLRWLALLPILAGVTIYFWCLVHFAVTGDGTPAVIDAPRRLVVRGLYRRVRNPMYIGVFGIVLGWCVFFRIRSLLEYAAVVALAFELFVLVIEEPSLRRQFGNEYVLYCKHVSRWLPGPKY